MNLQWLDETRPYAKDFDDIYYAEENGLSESQYVFIDQNNLEERFRKTESFFAIGELGFGTVLVKRIQVLEDGVVSTPFHLHRI